MKIHRIFSLFPVKTAAELLELAMLYAPDMRQSLAEAAAAFEEARHGVDNTVVPTLEHTPAALPETFAYVPPPTPTNSAVCPTAGEACQKLELRRGDRNDLVNVSVGDIPIEYEDISKNGEVVQEMNLEEARGCIPSEIENREQSEIGDSTNPASLNSVLNASTSICKLTSISKHFATTDNDSQSGNTSLVNKLTGESYNSRDYSTEATYTHPVQSPSFVSDNRNSLINNCESKKNIREIEASVRNSGHNTEYCDASVGDVSTIVCTTLNEGSTLGNTVGTGKCVTFDTENSVGTSECELSKLHFGATVDEMTFESELFEKPSRVPTQDKNTALLNSIKSIACDVLPVNDTPVSQSGENDTAMALNTDSFAIINERELALQLGGSVTAAPAADGKTMRNSEANASDSSST